MRKLSGELDYRIRYAVEHNLFHAKNVFNEAYIPPTFIEYVRKLEKENAELKARLNAINLLIPELEKLSKAKKQQLTKAKELLNEFMRISKASDEDFEHDYSELIGEAEQFIKEIEK